jgi:hypothetical protein
MRTRVLYVLVAALWLVAFAFFVHFASSHVFMLAKEQSAAAGNVAPALPRKDAADAVDVDRQANRIVEQSREQSSAASREDLAAARFASDSLAWNASIFINMAAYRDKLCHRTVWEAIAQSAANPARLYFGIFQQHNDTDGSRLLCLFQSSVRAAGRAVDRRLCRPATIRMRRTRARQIELACSVLPRIRISRVDYLAAQGPTVGRFVRARVHGRPGLLPADRHALALCRRLGRRARSSRGSWPTIPTPCSRPTRATRIT